jgi:hypothetical protein
VSTAASLTFQIGPTLIGGYISSISDIYQFLLMLDQGLTNLRSSQSKQSTNSQTASSGGAGSSSGGSSAGGSSGSSYTNTLPGDYHTVCGTLCK